VSFAAHLFRQRGYDTVIASGGLGRHPPTEAQLMMRLLIARGVPAEKTILDELAGTTIDTARFARAWQASHPDYVIDAVTDGYHKMRTGLALRAYRVNARVIAVRNTEPKSSLRQALKMWARETLALPYYLALACAIRLGLLE
jgi:uncharacterized SAM-binding protein YcdF (DUF218 family)